MTAYDDLLAFVRDTQALGEIAGRLGWDQETMMPSGAADQRADEFAAIESVLHARRTDPRIGEWLETAQAPDEIGAAVLRHVRRSYDRANKIPAKLATDLAKLTSKSQGIWAAARADNDFAAFAPTLAEVLRLKREEGAALAAGGAIYDAMLDDYEPGAKASDLTAMFDAMRPRLVALREAVLAQPAPKPVQGQFDDTQQMKLSQLLAETFGYDMTRGRIDKAVHPFSSGSGNDVRITTRTAADDPFNCFYSTSTPSIT